jgi:hypothetical protein
MEAQVKACAPAPQMPWSVGYSVEGSGQTAPNSSMQRCTWLKRTLRIPATLTEGMRWMATSLKRVWYGIPVDLAAAAIVIIGSIEVAPE